MNQIDVKNISKVYEEGEVKTHALDGLSFSIKKGEFVAITGPSGSGKSTLLHILGFLDRPTHGRYFFDGRSIGDYSDTELARIRNKSMGFVFQAFNLLPRTNVLDNVKLPLIYAEKEERDALRLAKKAIDAVGLSHRIDHVSSELSGGERQRVAIARALVNNPAVLFADEPTGNLDSKSGHVIMELIQELNKRLGHTVILVTHEKYVAEYASRIIHIRDGKIESDTGAHARSHA